MMLAGGEFRVVLATIHCALSEVPGRLSRDGLIRLFDLTCRALDRDFGLAGAPLGVAALNPHASEGRHVRPGRRGDHHSRDARGPGRGACR